MAAALTGKGKRCTFCSHYCVHSICTVFPIFPHKLDKYQSHISHMLQTYIQNMLAGPARCCANLLLYCQLYVLKRGEDVLWGGVFLHYSPVCLCQGPEKVLHYSFHYSIPRAIDSSKLSPQSLTCHISCRFRSNVFSRSDRERLV